MLGRACCGHGREAIACPELCGYLSFRSVFFHTSVSHVVKLSMGFENYVDVLARSLNHYEVMF